MGQTLSGKVSPDKGQSSYNVVTERIASQAVKPFEKAPWLSVIRSLAAAHLP